MRSKERTILMLRLAKKTKFCRTDCLPTQSENCVNIGVKKMKKTITFLIIVILLSACQGTVSEPPLPTVVSEQSTPVKETQETVEKTATVSPTITVEPTNSPEPIPLESLESLTIGLVPIAEGFTKPLYLTHAGDQTGRLFVVEQAGQISILENGIVNPTPFLDIETVVGSTANEQGLLSVAFHPNYADNGAFFVDYTDKGGNTVIARYHVSTDPDVADVGSGEIMLTIPQPYGNHNGGQILFGPDGYLYIGMGDGGAANDPHDNGQNLNILLGKILRIDVDNGQPYGVPADNPFVSVDARPEIWSYGWRNPWRISFDRLTGDMYIGDVGQNQYEEVDIEMVGTPGGGNYGWRLMEGNHCFNPSQCDPATLDVVLPIAEYSHEQGCSITGGYVYRGQEFPALQGVYIYGDYCTGTIWGLRHEADDTWSQAELLAGGYMISSFGEDETGELYLIDHQGYIAKIKK